MAEKRLLNIPDFAGMEKQEVEMWLATLSSNIVYANFKNLNYAVMDRFGDNARITASTHSSPKVIEVISEM